MPGTLFIISTPIGNLEDITLRALRLLKEVDLIACEDTRLTGKILSCNRIKKPLVSYSEHQWYHRSSGHKSKRIEFLIRELQKGKKIGLVSNAGTPLISDPGYNLVRACIQENIPVVPIPGVSAVTTALSVSGLPTDRFIFEGFLPLKTSKRRKRLQELKDNPRTIIFYEAPHRLLKTLRDLQQFLGERDMVAARELTKYYEEVRRGKIAEIIKYFSPPAEEDVPSGRAGSRRIKGEFTLVVAGASGATSAGARENKE